MRGGERERETEREKEECWNVQVEGVVYVCMRSMGRNVVCGL